MSAIDDGVSLWQEEAVCGGEDTNIFFTDERRAQRSIIGSICGMCPVQAECLTFAIVYNMHGIWGGTTDKEREKLSSVQVKMLRDDYIESGLYNKKLKV